MELLTQLKDIYMTLSPFLNLTMDLLLVTLFINLLLRVHRLENLKGIKDLLKEKKILKKAKAKK
jgi:hypothetical protein